MQVGSFRTPKHDWKHFKFDAGQQTAGEADEFAVWLKVPGTFLVEGLVSDAVNNSVEGGIFVDRK